MKKKDEQGPSKHAVMKAYRAIMTACEIEMGDVLDGDTAEIRDMSTQMINVMMSIEFAYICYRNRLGEFLTCLNNAAGKQIFDVSDVKAITAGARLTLNPLLKRVIMADKRLFERSLEVVELKVDVDAEELINVKERGEA